MDERVQIWPAGRFWDGMVSKELADDCVPIELNLGDLGSAKPFVVGMLWDALTYDPDEEERILHGNGKPMPTGVLHVDGSE